MAVKWSDDLSVGVAEVDKQHQELVARLNDLIEACNQGKGKAVVGDLIRFLEQYVVEHFQAEEKLQQKYMYPEYGAHKKQHEQFLSNFAKIKEQFAVDGATLPLVITLNRTVVSWLIEHVNKTDKVMGAYIKNKI